MDSQYVELKNCISSMQWKASLSLNTQDMYYIELKILQNIWKCILQCILEQVLYHIYTTLYILCAAFSV